MTSSSADTLPYQICYSCSQGHQHVMTHSTTRTQYSSLPHLRVTTESMVTVTHESSLSCHGHHGPEQHSSHHEQPHSSPHIIACDLQLAAAVTIGALGSTKRCIGQHQRVGVGTWRTGTNSPLQPAMSRVVWNDTEQSLSCQLRKQVSSATSCA